MSKKITELPELTTPADDDVLPIVDISGNQTKKIQMKNLVAQVTSVFGRTGDVVAETDDYELSQIRGITVSATAPSNPQIDDIWIDIS